MSVFFDPSLSSKITDNIVPDTGVLSLMALDPIFFSEFRDLSKNACILIDPTVKLEFLRGEYQEHLLEDKLKFLEYKQFYNMIDHYQIHKNVFNNALTISRIYAHNKKTNLKLGDNLIISRLALYSEPVLLATLDKHDYGSMLFDRIGAVVIERTTREMDDILSIMQLLRFNADKFHTCISRLPR